MLTFHCKSFLKQLALVEQIEDELRRKDPQAVAGEERSTNVVRIASRPEVTGEIQVRGEGFRAALTVTAYSTQRRVI